MGRRLNVSTPTVINTELIPLSESFYVEADGQLEQWYYENDERYAPNRKVTPMTLTPRISAFDKDTNTTYTPSFYIVRWFKLDWDDTQSDYVETEITNQVDSTAADYVKVGNDLLVKKNVGYTHSVTIICRAKYIDPRDSGITYNVEDSVLLTTNRDATILSPELNVLCPTSQAFNPLTDNHVDNGNLVYDSEFTMKATSDYSSLLSSNISQYKVDPLGTEEIKPDNASDVESCAPTMDIRYGDVEQSDQTFMERQTSGGQVPYIAGNMAYINKIKGNTVAWNQMVVNGDFSNGTTGWSANSVNTISVSNNILTITATSANVHVYVNQIYELKVVGHVMACFATVKSSVDTTGTTLSFGGNIINYHALTAGVWTDLKEIATVQNDSDSYRLYLDRAVARPIGTTLDVKNMMCIDLTLIYGAGNEPSTVEEFESWLAQNVGLQSYYPYNEGELIPVKMTGIKSVGFNLWDEEWEQGTLNNNGEPVTGNGFRAKNFCPIEGGVTINAFYNGFTNIYGKSIVVYYYDKDKSYITNIASTQKSYSYQIPQNAAYFKLRTGGQVVVDTYNHDICINLSDEARNGTYEAHWENEQYLPITEIKGKENGTGDLVTIFPDGMKRAGSVYDEIKVENGVVKAIKRIGSVDLGTLTWGQWAKEHFFASNFTNEVKTYGSSIAPNILCQNGYISDRWDLMYAYSRMKEISVYPTQGFVVVSDDAYDDGATLKSALNGVIMYYELKTPVEYIIENIPRGQFEWYGVDGGTEVLAETLPWYKSGQHTDTLKVDAMYGEEIRVVLRSRFSAGSDRLYPSKVYRSIVWKIPDVDINAYSENGGAVRSNTVSMDFDTIVNVKGSTLSDVIKNDNLRFNWKLRKSNSSNETDYGWGQRRTIPAEDLRNTIGQSSSLASTLVLPYGYLLGANEKVTDDGSVVTDNGEEVYDRPVF